MKDGEPFAIAGLWEQWEGQDGEVIESCTLLTTEPNDRLLGCARGGGRTGTPTSFPYRSGVSKKRRPILAMPSFEVNPRWPQLQAARDSTCTKSGDSPSARR